MSESRQEIFNPFGTFDTKGYLENSTGEKDLEKVKRMEHVAFSSGLQAALDMLALTDEVTYATVLDTHRMLFQDFYPWAGRDRLSTAPDQVISKGDVSSEFRTQFEMPVDIRLAFDYGLNMAADTAKMKTKVGTIMGTFAFAHPFLDGNGRTILLVHMELCFRAGFSIAWAQTRKIDYLQALSKEIDDPNKGHLDGYLSNFIIPTNSRDGWLDQILSIQGLDGGLGIDAMDEGVYVAGRTDDPEMIKRYQAQAASSRYPTDS